MLRAILFCAALAGTVGETKADDWTTFYERSGFRRTPDYATTVDYCRRLASSSPTVHYTTFGTSPQGRDLPLLIVDSDGRFDPPSVRAAGNLVVMIQAGIHAGEIDGKDAGLLLLRDVVINGEHAGLLDGITLLFIPIFNVDGHERSSGHGRANQNGPEEMGWRVTAQNLNLNRDYLKADAVEMQAWLRLYTKWLPEFFVDCHVTDGADYQYQVTYAVEQFGTLDPDMTHWLKDRFVAPFEAAMKADGVPTALYQWYRRYHDPRSGLRSWMASPRLSEGYCAEQNRPGLLLETHSLKDYRTRVEGTYAALVHTLEIVGDEHDRLRELVADADRRVAAPAFRDQPFALSYTMSDSDSVMIEHHGIQYDMVQSELTGGVWPRFTGQPVEFSIPFFHRQQVDRSVVLPEGYIVPVEWNDVIARLDMHGVQVYRITAPVTVAVESYRFTDVAWSDAPSEGRHRPSYTVERIPETRTFPAGSALIDMNQRAARVAAHALEPDGPDSFVAWGFFNAIFEQKEYIESYVIEPLAAQMLAEDPALREDFEAWRAEHADADPGTVRNWFYQRTPYWDSHLNRYPVGRIVSRETLQTLVH